MRLSACDIRPGKVLRVIDNYGTVKASAQGIFSETDDPDLLPPITQFILMSPTAFSQPRVGDTIWVWAFADNPQELLYTFRCDTENINGSELNNGYQDVEIQLKRNSDNGSILVGYNDDDGYIIDNSGSKIKIDNKKHDICLSHEDGPSLSISKEGISLGAKDKSHYKAVCGELLTEYLEDIKNILETIKNTAMSNPYTSSIGVAMSPLMSKLNDFKKMLSNTVTLEK